MERINDVLVQGAKTPSQTTRIIVDGESVEAFPGESVLSVLFAIGKKAISQNDRGVVTGAYCGMGICYCCTVEVNGKGKVRACKEKVSENMVICTRKNLWTELNRASENDIEIC